jgi:hypothetical protein
MDNSDAEEENPRTGAISEQMPKNIDFGFCAVGQETDLKFLLENLSGVDKHFSFHDCPFKISPQKGVLHAKSRLYVKIGYTPTEATVIVASTVFKVDGEEERLIKLSAIGKFPFLKTNNSNIDFEEIMYGKKKVKNLIINNASEVTTKFVVKKLEFDEFIDSSFSLDYTEGTVPPKSSFLIMVTYKPMIWDLYSCSHYEIVCSGGNTIQVQCVGKSSPVDVRISSRFINFGSIRSNSSTNRMATLTNLSDSPCTYEVLMEKDNVFTIKESIGVIKPKSHGRLLFIFSPQKTINYYQRVFIVVRNHAILQVDLLGNCFDLLIKPTPLLPSFIKMVRNDSFSSHEALLGKTTSTYLVDVGETHEKDDLTENYKPSAAEISHMHRELFGLYVFSEKFLVCKTKYLDFGFSDPNNPNLATREISVQNVSSRKLSLFWNNQTIEGVEHKFQVQPPTANLKSGEVGKFTVYFKPREKNSFEAQRLQCFAIDFESNMIEMINKASFKIKKKLMNVSNLKANNSSEMVTAEKQQVPPIEIAVDCIGNSFGPTTQPFIPMISIVPKNVISFSPVSRGQTAYSSIQLVNKTDTPSFFKFDTDPNGVFDMYPKFGIIEGHRFKLIFFKFTPREPSLYSHIAHCKLNNSVDVIKIKLIGYCCQPSLEIDNNGQVFFPPSYVGVFSKQKISFHNRSRIPLNFVINTQNKNKGELLFDPVQKVLLPNETSYVLCSMIPLKKKKYQLKVPVDVFGEQMDQVVESKQLEIFGEGGDGSLVIKPEIVDFGIIKVNFQQMQKITIYNHSHVSFFLQLDLRLSDETQKLDANTKRIINNSFEFDFREGLITGNSKIEVMITFKPIEICELKLKLVCIAKENLPRGVIIDQDKFLDSEKCSIEIRANGRFPVLKIIDIRNVDLSVATLWENFKIDRINKELLDTQNSSKPEIKDFEELSNSKQNDELIKKNYHEWDFGYKQSKPPIEPRKIVLTVENVGGTDLDFNFKFPNDNQVKKL